MDRLIRIALGLLLGGAAVISAPASAAPAIAAPASAAPATAEPPAPAAKGLSLSAGHDSLCVTVQEGGRVLAQYRFRSVPFKPYLAQLATPSGINVLRDSPHDHKHHHGLMFALKAEGVDFWSETPQCGRQDHRSLELAHSPDAAVAATVEFGEELDWTGADKTPVLRENRKLCFYRTADLGATLLTWSTRLEPPSGKSEVHLAGSQYFGLGMRFLEPMDKVGQMLFADARQSEVDRAGHRLTRSNWCAYSAPLNGKPVTVALFDHPGNPRHPARMFTMTTPFAYLSATLNLWKEPLLVKAGEPLKLRYGVAAWDGAVEPARIEQLYRRWLELPGDGGRK
jgi:hypothetical protein